MFSWERLWPGKRAGVLQWHYDRHGEPRGPISHAELLRLVDEGAIGPSTLLWRSGMSHWEPARRVLWRPFLVHSVRRAYRGTYGLAWVAFIAHWLSMVTFQVMHSHAHYRSSAWWMALAITASFLAFAIYLFEIDYSFTPLWLMPATAFLYGLFAAAVFPAFFHLLSYEDLAAASLSGKGFLVASFGLGSRTLLAWYPSRLVSLMLQNISLAALMLGGMVLMGKYVFLKQQTSTTTLVELGCLCGFAVIMLGKPLSRA